MKWHPCFDLNQKIGIVGALLCFPEGSLDSHIYNLDHVVQAPDSNQKCIEVEFASAAFMIIRKDVAREEGLNLDENFSLGYEDFDFSGRATRSHLQGCDSSKT